MSTEHTVRGLGSVPYLGLDASQGGPCQALDSGPVGDDEHNLCRAGWTLALFYEGLQVGAWNTKFKTLDIYSICDRCK